jgi:hypothetical protein
MTMTRETTTVAPRCGAGDHDGCPDGLANPCGCGCHRYADEAGWRDGAASEARAEGAPLAPASTDRLALAEAIREVRPRRDEWYAAVTYGRPGDPQTYTEPAHAAEATRYRILRVRAYALRRDRRA